MNRFYTVIGDSRNRARDAWGAVSSQPSWVQRASLLALLVFVGIPVLVLGAVLAVAFLLMLGALAGVGALAQRLRGILPRRDGRSNVRVIQRRE